MLAGWATLPGCPGESPTPTLGDLLSTAGDRGGLASDQGAGPTDLGFNADAGSDLAPLFCIGPHDFGNTLGVGLFCHQLSDCSATSEAHICAALDDLTQPYCTRACDGDASVKTCGDGALCAPSRTFGMLCVPIQCLPLDGGVPG